MTDIQENNNNTTVSEDRTTRQLLLKMQDWIKFILSKWLVISLVTIAGMVVAVCINLRSKTVYTAECTFTLDESNSEGVPSPVSGLTLLGLGGNASGGLFQGKNLMWLYSSREMLKQSLLFPVDSTKSKRLFIDWFFEFDKQGQKVLAASPNVKFPPYGERGELSREQNSLLSFAINKIKAQYLTVGETKNTDNFISVAIKSTDELFAKEFSDILVKTVNNYYINKKTEKLRNEILILQRKTDNYQGEMNSYMYQTADAADATPYPNPNQQVLQVPAQKKSVGVKVNSELYIEMVKSLEANKITLAKETPLIQVIEEPVLPLPSSRMQVYFAAIYGGFLFFFLTVTVLGVIRAYKNIMGNK